MKEYELTYKVSGYISVTVQATCLMEAQMAADAEIADTDFGKLENIEWDAENPVSVD